MSEINGQAPVASARKPEGIPESDLTATKDAYAAVRCQTCGQPRTDPGRGCQREGYHDRGPSNHRYGVVCDGERVTVKTIWGPDGNGHHPDLTIAQAWAAKPRGPLTVVDWKLGHEWRFGNSFESLRAATSLAEALNRALDVPSMTVSHPYEITLTDIRSVIPLGRGLAARLAEVDEKGHVRLQIYVRENG